mgnify:FL=1
MRGIFSPANLEYLKARTQTETCTNICEQTSVQFRLFRAFVQNGAESAEG